MKTPEITVVETNDEANEAFGNAGVGLNGRVIVTKLAVEMELYDALQPTERAVLALCQWKTSAVDYLNEQASDPTTLPFLWSIRSPDLLVAREKTLRDQRILDRRAIKLIRQISRTPPRRLRRLQSMASDSGSTIRQDQPKSN
jgi:hypothetical protein